MKRLAMQGLLTQHLVLQGLEAQGFPLEVPRPSQIRQPRPRAVGRGWGRRRRTWMWGRRER